MRKCHIGGDKLSFAGIVDSVLALAQVPGLRLAEDENEEVDLYKLRGDDILVEAVVAPRSELVHRTVRELGFRLDWRRISPTART